MTVDGFALMEIEVIEPSLFFDLSRDGADLFARAIGQVLELDVSCAEMPGLDELPQ